MMLERTRGSSVKMAAAVSSQDVSMARKYVTFVSALLAHYNPHMTIEQLRQLHSARPFKPCDIHLAEGRPLGFEHPELLAISPGGRTIHVGHADDPFETSICSWWLV